MRSQRIARTTWKRSFSAMETCILGQTKKAMGEPTERKLSTLAISVMHPDETLQPCLFGTCLLDQIRNTQRAGQSHTADSSDRSSLIPSLVENNLNSLEGLTWIPVHLGTTIDRGVILASTSKQDASFIELPMGHANPCPSASAQNDVNPVSSSVKLGVAVVVRSKEGYALMTQRHLSMKIFPGFWVVPGGHVDKGESLKEAAAREVKEEVGIELPEFALNPLCIWESCYPITIEEGSLQKQHLIVYFSANLEQTAEDINIIKQESEVEQACWINRALAYNTCGSVYRGDESFKVLDESGRERLSLTESLSKYTAKGSKFAVQTALS